MILYFASDLALINIVFSVYPQKFGESQREELEIRKKTFSNLFSMVKTKPKSFLKTLGKTMLTNTIIQ